MATEFKKSAVVEIKDEKQRIPVKVNHSTRMWEVYDPLTDSYISNGIPAVPDDDATSMKYFKLTNKPIQPTAPGDSETYWSDKASLNSAVIDNAGWSADPLGVSDENRFCWCAYYRLENILDTSTGTYKQKYKLNFVGIFTNYAVAPVISVGENGVVTIVNPDGSTQTHQLMTASAYGSLMTMVNSLQSQVDSAVYSYSGVGAPTKNHDLSPLNSWGIETGSPSNVVADIYGAHVGDTYTNTEDYVSYRFILKNGHSASDPLAYEWQVIADGALSAALAEIATLENNSVKIFTTQPIAPYKKGDIWIEGEVMKTCVVSKDENGTFETTDWIVPFVTKLELEAVENDLRQAKSNIELAQGNITDLQHNLNTLENDTLQAMQDSLIDDNERKALKILSENLDVEQEQLISNVRYLTDSPYLPDAEKNALENASNKLLTATTGTLDILQTKIADILNESGEQGNRISSAERQAYLDALSIYKQDHKALSEAIDTARAKVDDELNRISEERVSSINQGNFFSLSNVNEINPYVRVSEWYIELNRVDNHNPFITFTDAELNLKEDESYLFSFKFQVISGTVTHLGGHNLGYKKVNEDKLFLDKKVIKYKNYLSGFEYPQDNEEHLIEYYFTIPKGVPRTKFYLQPNRNHYGDKLYKVRVSEIQVRKTKYFLPWELSQKDLLFAINKQIESIDLEYGLSDSATDEPSTWNTNTPQWQLGKFIWSRMKTVLKNGDVNYSNVACIQGASGKGIKSIVEQYYHSNSAFELQGGSWGGDATTTAERYTWARTIISYTDNTTTSTEPIRYTGIKGEDALSVSIQVQGHFNNYIEFGFDEQGVETQTLRKQVVGGVMVGGTEYVQANLIIRKGSRDVTDRALANGANVQWFVNNVKRFGNVKTINLGLEFADGNDDWLYVKYDETNAKNW